MKILRDADYSTKYIDILMRAYENQDEGCAAEDKCVGEILFANSFKGILEKDEMLEFLTATPRLVAKAFGKFLRKYASEDWSVSINNEFENTKIIECKERFDKAMDFQLSTSSVLI